MDQKFLNLDSLRSTVQYYLMREPELLVSDKDGDETQINVPYFTIGCSIKGHDGGNGAVLESTPDRSFDALHLRPEPFNLTPVSTRMIPHNGTVRAIRKSNPFNLTP